jgi:hypothetical protein
LIAGQQDIALERWKIDSKKLQVQNLSKTCSLEPVKGHFPHHFNRPENQEYIDPIPDEDMFGVKNMSSDYYEKDFKPWYDSEKDRTDWNFLLRNAEILQA